MNKYTAPALDKGLDILEYLSKVAIPQTQQEIAQGLEKSPNEIYRMLVCLEQRGYLLKSATGGYSLSLKLYQLSHLHSPINGLLKIAKPHMDELAYSTKQSCHLGILQAGELMVVAQKRSPGPVSLSIAEGSLFPLIKTTSGRTLLAFLEKEQQKSLLEENEDYITLSDKEKKQLVSQLDKITERGYEIENSQITNGVTDIAVPIGTPNTEAFSVLAISSLTSISKKNESGEYLIEKIKETAQKINTVLMGS